MHNCKILVKEIKNLVYEERYYVQSSEDSSRKDVNPLHKDVHFNAVPIKILVRISVQTNTVNELE